MTGLIARRTHSRHRGMALPAALMLASMMLTTSAAWFEASIAQARLSASVHEHLRATQAADAALELCSDALREGIAPVQPALPGLPPAWTQAGNFDGPSAYEPIPSWPGSVRAPQCVIEVVPVGGGSDGHAYRITARGFGATPAAQAWLQRAIRYEDGRERRAWRRIVAIPEH